MRNTFVFTMNHFQSPPRRPVDTPHASFSPYLKAEMSVTRPPQYVSHTRQIAPLKVRLTRCHDAYAHAQDARVIVHLAQIFMSAALYR